MAARLAELPARDLGLIGLACAAIVVMLAENLVVAPAVRRLRRLDADTGIAREQLHHNLTMLQLEESVSAEYGKVRDLIGAVDTEAGGIEQLKSELDELASRAGLSLRSMRHLAPSRTEFLVTYEIDISEFSGEMAGLLNFVHALDEAPGMLRTARLTVSAPDEGTVVHGSMLITKVMTMNAATAASPPEG